ncbi:unnamed protein product [Sphagnum compactum]
MPFQLPSAEEKAAYVERQFDRIAFRYDLANDCISFGMHRLWKKKAIAQLKIKPGGKYLDVCCGSGDLALRIAEQCGPGSSVTGFDFSQKMLDVAANRSRNSTIARAREISWLRGDAQNLPFADNTFDGAIISFGLRNLTDLQKGINELARVVKPGARVVNLDLGHPTAPLFTPLYFSFSGTSFRLSAAFYRVTEPLTHICRRRLTPIRNRMHEDEAAGTELLYDCKEFSSIGIIGVLRLIPFLRRMGDEFLAQIAIRKPQAVLLVDYGGFNLPLASAIKKQFPGSTNSLFHFAAGLGFKAMADKYDC